MPLKPFSTITGQALKPQFVLKDHLGREFGVVEHYETDRLKATNHTLLEFYSSDPNLAKRPLMWLDIEKWEVLSGHGKNLPDEDFEAGLNAYLQSFSDSEREIRRDRAKRARFSEIVNLAEEGFTIAYQEMFPGELIKEDFPIVNISGKKYLVDDQYGIRPGEFANQVTLVFVEEHTSETALLCNWLFGQGYEILQSQLKESLCQQAIEALVENTELEKIYKERLIKMRREGTLLGISAKPYSPLTRKN